MKTKKSIPQNFSFRTFTEDTSRKIIFWINTLGRLLCFVTIRRLTGESGLCRLAQRRLMARSTRGGCDGGFFGYELDPNNVPVAHSNGKVKALCNANTRVASIFAELNL